MPGGMWAWDGHKFLLECKRQVYFSGCVSAANDAMAAVGTEQSRIRLPGVGDDRAVLKATQGPVGFCCLRALRQTFNPFFFISCTLWTFVLLQLQCDLCLDSLRYIGVRSCPWETWSWWLWGQQGGCFHEQGSTTWLRSGCWLLQLPASRRLNKNFMIG